MMKRMLAMFVVVSAVGKPWQEDTRLNASALSDGRLVVAETRDESAHEQMVANN